MFLPCVQSTLVDKSASILDILTYVPGVKQITYAFVRHTFFYQVRTAFQPFDGTDSQYTPQFVGGDTPQDCVPLLEQLSAENKGGVLVYSVEVGQASAAEDLQDARARAKQIVKQTIQSIDVVAETMDSTTATEDRSHWVAIKLVSSVASTAPFHSFHATLQTGLIPRSQSLINLSAHLTNSRKSSHIAYPGCPSPSDLNFLFEGKGSASGSPLTEQDIVDLRELHADLVQICTHCQKKRVKILVDAEHR